MAAQYFFHAVSLLLIFAVDAGAWIDTQNDIESATEYLSMTEQWPSAEDEDNIPDEDVNITSGPTIREGGSLSCRCWSASGDAGLFMQTECKCHGQHILSVPLTLPADLHRLTLYDCGLKKLERDDLQNYANTLTDL